MWSLGFGEVWMSADSCPPQGPRGPCVLAWGGFRDSPGVGDPWLALGLQVVGVCEPSFSWLGQCLADAESSAMRAQQVSTRGLEPLIRARNFKQRKSRLLGDSDVFIRVVARALEETLSSAMAACASSVRVDVGHPPGRVHPVEQGRARRSHDLLWKGGL